MYHILKKSSIERLMIKLLELLKVIRQNGILIRFRCLTGIGQDMMKRKFDVEYGLKFFEILLEESNGLS